MFFSSRTLRVIERACLAAGAVGLLVAGVAYFHGAVAAQQAVRSFKMVSITAGSDATTGQEASRESAAPGNWIGGEALALLSVNRLNLEVPVFFGTDKITLNKGAGLVETNAIPGEVGNIAIAGHRDSFFRPLQGMQIGDIVELRSENASRRFTVEEILITDALDISVLADTGDTILTLITCYPFHYVGYAPDRFIVRARLTDTSKPDSA